MQYNFGWWLFFWLLYCRGFWCISFDNSSILLIWFFLCFNFFHSWSIFFLFRFIRTAVYHLIFQFFGISIYFNNRSFLRDHCSVFLCFDFYSFADYLLSKRGVSNSGFHIGHYIYSCYNKLVVYQNYGWQKGN